MLVQLNSVVIDADAANRQEMANFLANHGVAVVHQLAVSDGLPAILGQNEPPQLVICNLDPNPQESLRKLAAFVRQFPAVSFFVLSQVVEPNLLMEAMHLGVKEFVPLPIVEERFAAGIERVAQLHGMNKRARIVNVIPTIGGCGATTVACNVAASLARSGKTVLIDLDLPRGAVASSFDLRPRFTIADVMDSTTLDRQLLDNALAVHTQSGLAILARPEMPEDTQRVTADGFARLLGILGRMYDNIVIDSQMSLDPVYSTVLRDADLNAFVIQLNVPSAKNTERFIGSLRRMGIEQNRIKIIVNRYVKKGWDIAPEEVERSLGLKISWLIPNDFKNAIAAINFGEPVVIRSPRADMSASLFGLAEAISGRLAA